MLMTKHEKAILNGKLSDFDPARPWEAVWDALVTKCGDWWEKQLKGPCQAVAMGLKKMSAYIGGDALTAHGNATTSLPSHSPHPGVMRTETVPLHFKGNDETQSHPPVHQEPRTKAPKLALLDAPATHPGVVAYTRKNKGICAGFQDGFCSHTGNGNSCGRDGSVLHICSLCRMPGHGANRCSGKQDANPNPGKAKGGGKNAWQKRRGRKGGKGGK